MPLMSGKSKKAFKHNVEAEMHAGKPQKQSLAIAFSVQRKKKKYAEGGSIKDEKRPMPDQEHNDKAEAQRNSGDKLAHQDKWTSRPDIAQSQKGKLQPLKHPKMVPQSGYSVRLRDEEDHLISKDAPASPKERPPHHDDEMQPDRSGPKVPDMQRQHDNGHKAYAKGGMINEEVSFKDSEEDHIEHPSHLEEDDDQMLSPKDEFMADHFAEGGMAHKSMEQLKSFRGSPEEEHAHRKEIANRHDKEAKRYGYAKGGMVDNEEELEHAASIAAAIMSKMRSQKLAEGGEVVGSQDSMFDIMKKKRNGEDSIDSHPDEDQADLSRNAEEDANMADDSNYDALRKENYSESEGLEALDQPYDSNLHGDPHEDDEEDIDDASIVSAIRSKMRRKSPITR